MTGVEMLQATAEQARTLTDRIKVAVDGTWLLIQEAYVSRAWSALGYASWDDYCTREFGTSRLRLPRETRQEVVASLREIGMSVRAIAAATGNSIGTVHSELTAGVQNRTPAVVRTPVFDDALRVNDVDPDEVDDEEYAAMTGQVESGDFGPVPVPYPPRPITGTDGKTYTQPAVRPQQKPRTDVVTTVNRALQRAQEAARAADEITRQHLAGRHEEAATWGRSLSTSMQSLQRLVDQLTEAQQ